MAALAIRLRKPFWLTPVVLILTSGCGLTQRSRLDDCSRRVQALQAENSQLRDETLSLRSRSREIARRSVDDSAKLQRLQAANRDLERSILAYQAERDELADAFDQVRRLVSAGAASTTVEATRDPGPTLDQRLDAFARAHPGCRYDPEQRVWSVPERQLFQPGSDQFLPGADLLLQGLGRLLTEAREPIAPTRIVAEVLDSPVKLAGVSPPSDDANLLARTRAERVRTTLNDVLPASDSEPSIELAERSVGDAKDLMAAEESSALIRIHLPDQE